MSSDKEIQARIDRLKAAEREKGRGLTEDEFDAMFGPAYRPARAPRAVAKDWMPSCAERVLSAAAVLCDSRNRVRAPDVARRIGVSDSTVHAAMKALAARGRWPYASFRDRRSKTCLGRRAG